MTNCFDLWKISTVKQNNQALLSGTYASMKVLSHLCLRMFHLSAKRLLQFLESGLETLVFNSEWVDLLVRDHVSC